MVCWGQWQNLNSIVWQNKNSSVPGLVNQASQQLLAWNSARSREIGEIELQVNKHDGAVVWCCPKAGWSKVNVDITMFEEDGRIAVGCVVRNDKGVVLQAMNLLGSFSAGEAEATGVREAPSWLKGWDKLVALDVILHIRNPEVVEGDV